MLELVIHHLEKDYDHDYTPLKCDPSEIAKEEILFKKILRTFLNLDLYGTLF